MIKIKEVKSKSDLRIFIHLPVKIHSNYPNFLPPLLIDDWKFFNPAKNRSFDSCDTVLVLAYKNEKPAGRIMGIIHRKYNELHGERNGRFGYFECYDDQETAHALISFIENWAKEKGVSKLVGPYGFSDKDPQGLLIEGYEHPPILAAASNPPYIVKLIEKEGYTKEVDCVDYMYPLPESLPDYYYKISQRFQEREQYQVIEFTKRNQLKPYVIPILRMMNEAYSHIYGFVPLTEKEMLDFAARYMSLLDPRFVKTIVKDGEIMAFIIGIPSLAKGIQRAKGKLFPFGIFKIIHESKKTRQVDLMLGAVKPQYQGLGLDVSMGIKLFESVKKAGFIQIEVHLILETNHKMLAEMEKIGAKMHKRFRVFQKAI
jgi:hypothetical protein